MEKQSQKQSGTSHYSISRYLYGEECQVCKNVSKLLYQPIRYMGNFMVCEKCLFNVCQKIDARGYDRDYLSNYDTSKIEN